MDEPMTMINYVSVVFLRSALLLTQKTGRERIMVTRVDLNGSSG
jgi:hypothetical protein